MKLLYPAIITPFDDERGFVVEVPDLPGCITEGKSLIEAIEMGIDAASGWILDEIENGNGYPAPSEKNKIKVSGSSFVNLLVIDIDAYADKYSNKAVRRNITIPACLDTYARKNNLNLSHVVQDALMKQAQNNS